MYDMNYMYYTQLHLHVRAEDNGQEENVRPHPLVSVLNLRLLSAPPGPQGTMNGNMNGNNCSGSIGAGAN